ncbi:adenine deaminase [Rhodohalobacter sp. SW132]|uniref:adenine deaminase n=1 Tax=Rhodohalobacter sp. SW132 TaxID=2293433 RepID=UPI000E26A4F4|nr:adenine deaminase [Rhodohalobacter sp. SW132]REL33201.1 adenine deaminase [Rhodohalobacter sp. SW132]
MTSIQGTILDPLQNRTYHGTIHIKEGFIQSIDEKPDLPGNGTYIAPGFVDSHIHIESSMLIPSEFARLALRHGTVATVSDPHEIANVCGMDGVEFMIENGEKVPLKFFFGAPSCVPATPFETAGAQLTPADVAKLLDRDDIHYLAEMMNWPGVLNGDPEVLEKIQAAQEREKPVDGHAPGLTGDQAHAYASAGISTDHECFTIGEARDKIAAGMMIAIREGSAAKNYNALHPLLKESPANIMFCSDDKHPDDLMEGHINILAERSLRLGYPLFDTLRACSVHAVQHYNLNVGLLQAGDPADFVIMDDPDTMHISETWIDGKCVYKDGEVLFDRPKSRIINHFVPRQISESEIKARTDQPDGTADFPVIVARDGELITEKSVEKLKISSGEILADSSRDILKITVVNRYRNEEPAVGFIKNFGIKNGAIASSVAHDSHNIIAVGSSDEHLASVINQVMDAKGGVAVSDDSGSDLLSLPVGGIMTDRPGDEVGLHYKKLTQRAKDLGSTLHSPFMTISFMALLVIPKLKMSDMGLFDAEKFEFI